MLQKFTLRTKPEVIIAARMASRKEGVELDEWLSNTIIHAARACIKDRTKAVVVKEAPPKYKHLRKK
jgi:hypothetical protein